VLREGFDADDTLEIISWSSYLRFWKQNFPELRVRPEVEDTCTDCHRIVCKLRGLNLRKDRLEKQDSTADDEDDEEEPEQLEEGATIGQLEEVIEELESEMADARIHVDMHEAQR